MRRYTVRRRQDLSPCWNLTANTLHGTATSGLYSPPTAQHWAGQHHGGWASPDLRVGDVLLRNLILYADSRDHASWEHQGEEPNNNLRQLEQAILSCGVSFQIWQKREPTGKPISGSYDWTALTGKHKLQVLKMLPEKMSTLMPDSISPRVPALWRVSMHNMHNILFWNYFYHHLNFYLGFVVLYTYTMTSWNLSPIEIDRFHGQVIVGTTVMGVYSMLRFKLCSVFYLYRPNNGFVTLSSWGIWCRATSASMSLPTCISWCSMCQRCWGSSATLNGFRDRLSKTSDNHLLFWFYNSFLY